MYITYESTALSRERSVAKNLLVRVQRVDQLDNPRFEFERNYLNCKYLTQIPLGV